MKNALSSILAFATILLAAKANAAQITILDPTYSTSYYESTSKNQDASLFMIGVYETRSDHGFGYHPTGTATVNIANQNERDTTLVLSAYEPTTWNLLGEGVDDLTNIFLFGYHEQSVTGVNDFASVTEYSYEGNGNYKGFTYTYPGDGRVVNLVNSLTGLNVDSFAGSYRATQFSIGESNIDNSRATSVPEPSTMLATIALGISSLLVRKYKAR